MAKYVFVGSEAQGYYSNAYECEGVFVSSDFYESNKKVLEDSFGGRSFYELDGKHSEVDGDLIVKHFDSHSEIALFAEDSDVSYETYHFTDYTDGEFPEIDKHVKDVYVEIEAIVAEYKAFTYVLTAEQNEVVSKFIEELKKGAR